MPPPFYVLLRAELDPVGCGAVLIVVDLRGAYSRDGTEADPLRMVRGSDTGSAMAPKYN